MLNVRVKNVLGVALAEFPIEGITLIVGRNGAGKSSLLGSVACAALGSPFARGISKKKDLGEVLHEGAEVGSATLDWGAGQMRMVWPDGRVETTGQPKVDGFGTPVALGTVRFATLDDRQRAQEFAARCDAAPTAEDIAAWLEANGGNAAEAPALFERVDRSSWDATHKAAQEAATTLKGRWTQVAGTAWGDKKAESWRPGSLLPDEAYTVEGAEEALQQARDELEDILAAGAVDNEERKRLAALAATEEDLAARDAELDAEAKRLLRAAEVLEREKQALPSANDDEAPQPCPHCGKPLKLTRTANSVPVISKNPPTLTKAEIEKRRQAITVADTAAKQARAQADAAHAEALEVKVRARDAAKAREKLAEIGGKVAPAANRMAEHRLAVTKLEQRVEAVRAMFQARGIFNDWKRCQPMIAVLAPEGVRAWKAGLAVGAFNEELAAISEAGKFGVVAMTSDMGVTLHGRSYGLLSESEQWRCDAVLSMAFAKREGAAFVILDRLDVLVRDARPGVFRALMSLGLPAIVACTVPDREPGTLPDLQKAKAGRVWWIEDGTLQATEF